MRCFRHTNRRRGLLDRVFRLLFSPLVYLTWDDTKHEDMLSKTIVVVP